MNIEYICEQVVELSLTVGEYLREENKRLDKSRVEVKGENDFVTYVDKESEKRLIEGLSNIFPDAGFLAEESAFEFQEREYCWIVDPIDGTTNFIHQLSPYAISIALAKKNKIILGCVYEVTLDEAFYAYSGGGAWLNGINIQISGKKEISGSVVAHGIPYQLEEKYEYLRTKIAQLYGKCTLRHLGSAATEICYVAAGRLDTYFHDNLSPWDLAAGAIILQEAGGGISDFSGNDNYIFGKELVATNGWMHQEVLEFLKK